MKNLSIILAIILLGLISDTQAENRRSSIDSIRKRLKTAPMDTARVNLLNDLSADYIDCDLYDSAISVASTSRELAQRLRFDVGTAISLRRIGVALSEQGDYPKALEYFFQSLNISDAIKNDRESAMTFNATGIAYVGQKYYEYALNYFFKALSTKNNNDALTYANIGRVYRLQFKYNLSMTFYRKAIDAWRNNKNEISSVLNNIGDNYEQQNDYANALKYYLQSLSIKQGLNDIQGIADASGSVGDLMLRKNKFREAIPYEDTSLSMSTKINYKYGIRESLKLLSAIYEHLGDSGKSLYYYKQYIDLRDKMYNEENTKKVIRNEMNFQFDKKEAVQKIEQDKKDAIATSELRAVIIGLCLVIVFSFFLYRSYKQTNRAKNIITEQKKIVDQKSKEITDNINYAKRIVDATMPSISRVKELFPNSFIFNSGKDIVSGDFYFVEKISDDRIIFSVADSTSHGVSGSMMSILNSNLLNEAVRSGIYTPSKILDYVNMALARSFHQTGEDKDIKDGMDISLCCIDIKNMELQFSGAYNPLLILRDGGFIEVEADKLQMGHAKNLYINHIIPLKNNDRIFLSSDGYSDQFGGPKEKKLKYKNFMKILQETSVYNMDESGKLIKEKFENWKGENEQTDDVLVMGIQI